MMQENAILNKIQNDFANCLEVRLLIINRKKNIEQQVNR